MHVELELERVVEAEAREGTATKARHEHRGRPQGARVRCVGASVLPSRAAHGLTIHTQASEASLLIADALRPRICEVVREELATQRPAAADVYLSTRAAAAVADVAPGTIRRWLAEGRLTGHHAGRVLRIRRADLEQLLAAAPRRSRRPRVMPDLTPEQRARRDLGVG